LQQEEEGESNEVKNKGRIRKKGMHISQKELLSAGYVLGPAVEIAATAEATMRGQVLLNGTRNAHTFHSICTSEYLSVSLFISPSLCVIIP